MVERQASCNLFNLCLSGFIVFLVRFKAFLCWPWRRVGFKIVRLRHFLFNFSDFNIYIFTRKHVYTQDSFLCVFINMYYNNPSLLEIDVILFCLKLSEHHFAKYLYIMDRPCECNAKQNFLICHIL